MVSRLMIWAFAVLATVTMTIAMVSIYGANLTPLWIGLSVYSFLITIMLLAEWVVNQFQEIVEGLTSDSEER